MKNEIVIKQVIFRIMKHLIVKQKLKGLIDYFLSFVYKKLFLLEFGKN